MWPELPKSMASFPGECESCGDRVTLSNSEAGLGAHTSALVPAYPRE